MREYSLPMACNNSLSEEKGKLALQPTHSIFIWMHPHHGEEDFLDPSQPLSTYPPTIHLQHMNVA